MRDETERALNALHDPNHLRRASAAYEVTSAGQPVGVVIVTPDRFSPNPRAIDETSNVGRVSLLEYTDEFSTLNELDIPDDGLGEQTAEDNFRLAERIYGDADTVTVPIRVRSDIVGRRLETGTTEDVEASNIVGLAVISRETISNDFHGDEAQANAALNESLRIYSDWAGGFTRSATLRTLDGHTETEYDMHFRDPKDAARVVVNRRANSQELFLGREIL